VKSLYEKRSTRAHSNSFVKRDLLLCEKRPTKVFVKRDLLVLTAIFSTEGAHSIAGRYKSDFSFDH
jgi:hypothetical protein